MSHTAHAPTRPCSTTSSSSCAEAASSPRCWPPSVEQYGYSLRKVLADHALDVDEGTLYPLLRRLETQGLLDSEWREEGKRNKRFYRLSSSGAAMLGQLLDEWRAIDASLHGLLREFHR